MLQSVRKYTQGWVATVMGIILSFAFVLWGVENYLSGNSKKHLAAKVNGKEITTTDVENDFHRTLTRLRDQVGSNFNLPAPMQQQLKYQALDNLIMQNILSQAALKSGFKVTAQETTAMIKQMPAFQENGKFSRERFQLIINKMSYNQQEFFNDVANALLLNQVASGIAGTDFVLPNELNQAITLLEQKRDIEYTVISSESFKKDIQVSPEQIKQYYLQNKKQFKTPAKVQIDYILLSAEDIKKSLQVTEKDLGDYFEANSDINKKDSKAVEKAKESIRQQKLEQTFLSASDKLTDLFYTNPNSLDEAAKELGLKMNSTEYFTQEGGESLLTKNPKVISAAFNQEILKNRTNSNLIEIAPGKVMVLRVKNYKPENFAAISEVEDKIKHHLVEAGAVAKAKEKGMSIIGKLQSEGDFQKIIAKEHLQLISKNQVSRHEKNMNPNILQVAFSASPLAKKPVNATLLANGDYVVVVIKGSYNVPAENVKDEQRRNMSKLFSDMYGKLDYNLYIQNQVESSKIKTFTK